MNQSGGPGGKHDARERGQHVGAALVRRAHNAGRQVRDLLLTLQDLELQGPLLGLLCRQVAPDHGHPIVLRPDEGPSGAYGGSPALLGVLALPLPLDLEHLGLDPATQVSGAQAQTAGQHPGLHLPRHLLGAVAGLAQHHEGLVHEEHPRCEQLQRQRQCRRDTCRVTEPVGRGGAPEHQRAGELQVDELLELGPPSLTLD